MAILDLKTNLKSLKYESGNEPFVTKDINNPPSSSGLASQVTRRVDDVVRVTKAILPANSRFLQNQALLKQIDLSQKIDGIKAAQGKTTAGAIIQQVKDTVVGVAKIAASTIAQTAVAGTGLHIVQGFETKTKKAYGNEAMANGVVNFPGFNPGTELSALTDYGYSNKLNISGSYISGDSDNGNSTLNALLVSQERGVVSVPRAELELSNFLNPQSRLNRPSPLKVQLADKDLAGKSFTIDQATGKPVVDNPLELKIRDFRQGRTDIISFDYSAPTINKELRIGLGNKGYWKKPVDYTKTRAEAVDRLNARDVSLNQLDGVGVGASSVRDLIKFRFEVLTPGQNPRFLYFRALLTSFDDNYTGNWSSTNYIGRGDAVRIYEGFSREVSVGFKIVATTREEMKPLYKKMVYLASTTAPTYGEGGNFMKGTIVRLTVGSYLYEVPGVINSVKYTWQENYPWEIALQNPENAIDDDMQELPHIMDCSVSFGVIHDFTPQTGLYHYITSPTLAGGASPFFLSGAQV
jgi:hypothetical protein